MCLLPVDGAENCAGRAWDTWEGKASRLASDIFKQVLLGLEGTQMLLRGGNAVFR